MHIASRLVLYALPLSALICGWGPRICFAQNAATSTAKPSPAENDGNALCYTCHLGLKNEEITAKHIAQNIACPICHGPSVEHMHDEMQVTKPDVLHGRAEIDRMCSPCHAAHKDANKVEVFRKEWLGKTRPNGRVITEKSICTDCHGSHNFISKQTTHAASAAEENWRSLFNGENLDGWQATNPAAWSVKTGRIIGKPVANADAGLWSKDQYDDYKLSITFKPDSSPAAWISLRDIDPQTQLRLELFDRPQEGIFAPSLSIAGKAVILANLNKDLIDRVGWNTLVAELKAGSCTVTINDERVGSVRVKTQPKGRIGFHIEKAPGIDSAQISISEIHIQGLSASEK